MSETAKAKISAAQKIRLAKQTGAKSKVAVRKRRKMSEAAIAMMSARSKGKMGEYTKI